MSWCIHHVSWRSLSCAVCPAWRLKALASERSFDPVTCGLRLGESEVLRSSGAQGVATSEYRSPGRERKRGFFLDRTVVNTGTASKATLGKLLRDRMERIWAFPSA